MRNLLILQARLGSSRLPGKVLKKIKGKPLIMYQIERIQQSKLLDDFIVAIPECKDDDELNQFLIENDVKVSRGNLNDVFSRFNNVIEKSNADVIIRSTADCPLFMPEILDQMLERFYISKCDYMSNSIEPSFPDGLDIEIFTKLAFSCLLQSELSDLQREHVTLAFYDGTHDFNICNFTNENDLSSQRWTVDYIEDFEFVDKIYQKFSTKTSMKELVDFLESNPSFTNSRTHEYRNIALRGVFDA